MLTLLGLLPCLPLMIGVWCWARPSRDPNARRSVLASFAWGVGWLSACALPAVAYQAALQLSGSLPTSFEAGDVARGLPFSWWVLLGGESVQSLFEATAKDLTGHRQTTMLDNWPYYAALTYVQVALGGGLVAVRRRLGRGTLDPWVLLLGLAVVVNGCLGARWPWWGS